MSLVLLVLLHSTIYSTFVIHTQVLSVILIGASYSYKSSYHFNRGVKEIPNLQFHSVVLLLKEKMQITLSIYVART